MDSFLESYGLPAQRFRSMILNQSVIFSGSAALALYLRQEGIVGDGVFQPNDIDLWIHCSKDPYDFLDLFLAHGYHLVRSFHQQDQYMERLNHIQRIFTFQHVEHDYKIQLISVDYPNLLDYITDQFDLSACVTWWNGHDGLFETMYPMLTDRKQMFIRRSFLSNIDQGRAEGRIQKYIQRGFQVVQEPPPCLSEGDRRMEADMKGLDMKAFDVWQYEEVDGREHLTASLWNILVYVGENWYSFERKALTGYMEEHRRTKWYDTPYRHTLSHDALTALFYMDFSIYRLVDPFVVDINGVSKTVYTVEAYTVADWCRRVPSRVYEHGLGLFLVDPVGPIHDADILPLEPYRMAIQEDQDRDNQELILLLADELHVDLALAPIPFIPIPDIYLPDSYMNPVDQELYQQFLEWINADPSM